MDQPLISFIMIAYNQESFIREALAGAMAQTYSPLEIILSDDCSTDRTFEIMQQVVADYKGPHSIQLNRNPKTLGIGRHVNRLMEFSRGKLIVIAAGDDISIPDRTTTIHHAWKQSGEHATSIFSSFTTIDTNGIPCGQGEPKGVSDETGEFVSLKGDLFTFLSTHTPVVYGCTHAWSPALFKTFAPLTADREDLVLSFRSLAISEILYIRKPLVLYRRHGGNASFPAGKDDTRSFEDREKRLRWADEQTVMSYDNMIHDIDQLCDQGRLTSAERKRLRDEAGRIRKLYYVERKMMDGKLMQRLLFLAKTALAGDFRCALRSSPRALPHELYKTLYLLRERWT